MNVDTVKAAVEAAIPDAVVIVQDPQNDGQHLQAIVVSKTFEGMLLVRQHKAVMTALKASFDSNDLHALALKTFTPDKWNEVRHTFGY